MTITLEHKELLELHQHALNTYPKECCGFFYGEDIDGNRSISEVRAVVNNKSGDQRRRYEIDPLDYLKAEKYGLNRGITLLGIYHSHPDHPAKPSDHDLKGAVPFFSYLILSVGKDKVKDLTSWQLIGDQFVEEDVVIVNQVESLN